MTEVKYVSEGKNWIAHVEFVVLLTTLIGGFFVISGNIDNQSRRTDRLYEIYVEGQKGLTELRKDMDKKFYDMLKEKTNKKEV